jgi:hypothetical protein
MLLSTPQTPRDPRLFLWHAAHHFCCSKQGSWGSLAGGVRDAVSGAWCDSGPRRSNHRRDGDDNPNLQSSMLTQNVLCLDQGQTLVVSRHMPTTARGIEAPCFKGHLTFSREASVLGRWTRRGSMTQAMHYPSSHGLPSFIQQASEW